MKRNVTAGVVCSLNPFTFTEAVVIASVMVERIQSVTYSLY